jgi:deazaflavin-dependent oxidoreductase (nitroreductase family)
VNRLLTWLLQTPGSRLVDRSLALLAVTGRRSGRSYTFPVQYARHGDTLWICVGDGAEKTWWRNLTSPSPVHVLLRRTLCAGTAQALQARMEPEEVAEGLRHYRARYPKMVRRLAPADMNTVMVRVDLDPDKPSR